MSAARIWLASTLLCLIACAGTVPVPMVQVPLFRQRGEAEAGLVMGPASRRPEIGGAARYAATETLRVGGSVSAAGGPSVPRGEARDPRDQAPRLFADGFLGAEWGGLVIRYGALVGSGFGLRGASGSRCVASASGERTCMGPVGAAQEARFVRSYGQLHMALAPPGPLAVSLAVRVPIVVELEHDGLSRSSEVGTEVALTQTVRFRHLRLDLQPLWSRTRGFAFHLALLLRFAGDGGG